VSPQTLQMVLIF